jgi:hypothetical protein
MERRPMVRLRESMDASMLAAGVSYVMDGEV